MIFSSRIISAYPFLQHNQLPQVLDMPLVEVWLGLLHSPTPYQWDGTGEFYRDARDFWIGN